MAAIEQTILEVVMSLDSLNCIALHCFALYISCVVVVVNKCTQNSNMIEKLNKLVLKIH